MRGCARFAAVLALIGAAAAAAAAAQMNPVLVGSLVGGNPTAIVVQGHYAFCPAEGGLSVFDLTDPSSPALVGACDTHGLAMDIALSGTLAYVATWNDNGIQVVDISDPTSPHEVSFYRTPECCYPDSLVVTGQHLLFAPYGGMSVLDISDPLNPYEIGSYRPYPPMNAERLTVSGSSVYAACNDGLRVLDISQPSGPAEIAWYSTDGTFGDIAVQGNLAYIATWSNPGYQEGGLLILDISQPSAPVQVGFSASALHPCGVTLSGEYAYLADQELGVEVFDVSDPAAPKAVATCNTPGLSRDTAVYSYHLLVADSGGGLRALDIQDPSHIAEVGAFDPPADTWSMAVVGDTAYLADSFNGLFLVDVSDPAKPQPVSVVSTSGIAAAVAVAGKYLYAAAAYGGLRIFDISQPRAPVEVGSLATPQYALSIAVWGDYVLVGDISDHVRLIDVFDPAHPLEVGSCQTPGMPGMISVSGEYAYVATSAPPSGDAGVTVIHLSAKAAPAVVTTFPLPACRGVWAAETAVYAADDQLGLVTLDISKPDTPELLSICQPTGSAQSVTVCGSYAYIGGSAGVEVIGLTDPAAPVRVGRYQVFEWPFCIAVAGERVYVSDVGWGLEVLKLPITFSDLSLAHWALDAVERCHSAGIVAGYSDGTYRPEDAVARDQMAVYIARALAGGDAYVPTSPGTQRFRDIEPGFWAYRYIEYAAANGIVEGYDDYTYRPSEPLDRGQMSVYIARAIARPTGEAGLADYVPPLSPTFGDVDAGFWAYKYVEYIAQASVGVTKGYPDGDYHPEYICTRDQMAVYVARAFQLPV